MCQRTDEGVGDDQAHQEGSFGNAMSGETEKEESGWTVDTLNYYFQQQISLMQETFRAQLVAMQSMLDERYQTQTKAVDAAFLAQQTAMQTALTAAERAVATALLSAEKAVAKAEVAADKRFESVNEFRAQLADQANTFLSRSEALTTISAVRTEAEGGFRRNQERIQELADRINTAEGNRSGSSESRTNQRSDSTIMVSIIMAFFAFAAIATTIVIATRK